MWPSTGTSSWPGISAVEKAGTPIPEGTLQSIRERKLALKGPLTTPVGSGFRSVNVALRKEFELFANLRPALTILPGRYDDIDIVLVRENLEGLYSGVEHFIQIGSDPARRGGLGGHPHPAGRRSGSCGTPSTTRSPTAARR